MGNKNFSTFNDICAEYTVNSLLSPPGGIIDFKHSRGGILEGGLINFLKTFNS